MDAHMYRNNIKPGSHVKIVLKQDQKSGKLTEGYEKFGENNSAMMLPDAV